ncbi:ribonuclease H-like domain-containing protein [Tanacetum coccineum]
MKKTPGHVGSECVCVKTLGEGGRGPGYIEISTPCTRLRASTRGRVLLKRGNDEDMIQELSEEYMDMIQEHGKNDNLDTSPIALRLLTTPTSPQQTPPQTTPQTTPQATPQTTPLTPLPTPSPLNTTLPPNTPPPNNSPPPPPPSTSQHPMVTRSKVGIVKANPKYNFHVTTSSPIPKSPFHALRDPNWKQAMCDEYKALIDNKTWVLVPRPPNVNIVRSMWLYKHKYNADGSLSRYKARLVANGRSQQQGIDCDETFSPVVKPATIRTVLSLAVSRQWPIHQLDVKNAFLHGHLTETVYMHQPPGFTDSAHSDYVCLLQKSLYGLKQAPRAWFQRFSSYAIRAGFYHSKTDSSLFIFHKGPDTAYLLLYVDDIILTASSTSLLQRIISSLHAEFAMTDLGHILGISATSTNSGIFLSQTKYAIEVLERAHMLNYFVPPPYTGNFMPPKPDLSFSGLEEFVNEPIVSEPTVKKPVVETSEAKASADKPKVVRKNFGPPLIEDWISDSEDEAESKPKIEKKTVKPSFAKIEFVKSKEQVKSPRKTTVKQGDQNRLNTHSPRGNQRNWNYMMSQRLGSNFEMINKACYVCGSFDHLQYDCDNHQRQFNNKKMVKPVWNYT